MDKLVLTLHIVACVLLVIFVLLQSGKEGMGVIFGGGSSSLFGSTGAGGILVKLTTFVAVIFFCTSLGYSIIISNDASPAESRIRQVNIEDMPVPMEPAVEESLVHESEAPATAADPVISDDAAAASNEPAPVTESDLVHESEAPATAADPVE